MGNLVGLDGAVARLGAAGAVLIFFVSQVACGGAMEPTPTEARSSALSTGPFPTISVPNSPSARFFVSVQDSLDGGRSVAVPTNLVTLPNGGVVGAGASASLVNEINDSTNGDIYQLRWYRSDLLPVNQFVDTHVHTLLSVASNSTAYNDVTIPIVGPGTYRVFASGASQPGSSGRTSIVVVGVANGPRSTLTLTACNSAGRPSPNCTYFFSSWPIEVEFVVAGGSADLAVSAVDSPDPVVVGQPLRYVVNISNGGPERAENVTLGGTLPQEVVFESATASQGSCNGVNCSLGGLASGASVTATFNARARQAGSATATFQVASSTPDTNGANNAAALSTTITDPCAPGTPFMDVVLPGIVVPINIPTKPWQIAYDELPVDFQAVTAPQGAYCAVASETASLPVMARPALVVGVGPFIPYATSTARAFVTFHEPGAIAPGRCSFSVVGGVNNNCTLNGPIGPDLDGHYVQWQTPGFTTTFLTALPQPLSTGPLSFWVHLESLGLSPATHTIDFLLRRVEAYVHVKLIQDLPSVSAYTIVQDPGRVTLRVATESGVATGVLADGSVAQQIPGSMYYPSPDNPGALLAVPAQGRYVVQVSGLETGPFSLSTATINMLQSPPLISESSLSGEIQAGATLVYTLVIGGDGGQPTHTFAPDPEGSIAALSSYVQGLGIHQGVKRSLTAKLNSAAASLARSNLRAARASLTSFSNEVRAQRRHKIPADVADQLIGWAMAVSDQAADDGGCQ
jgi:uncharacterized repeat protein (TIGR01451 family)